MSGATTAIHAGTLETLVDHQFEATAAADEERLGDAWAERHGADPSPFVVQGHVYAESDDGLSDAWLARLGIEETF